MRLGEKMDIRPAGRFADRDRERRMWQSPRCVGTAGFIGGGSTDLADRIGGKHHTAAGQPINNELMLFQ